MGYKSVMAVAHVGSVVCMLAMAMGSPKLALISMFLSIRRCAALPRPVCMPCARSWPARVRRVAGWVFKIRSATSRESSRPGSPGTSSKPPGIFTNAFVVAAVMSMLGVIGWILMVPRLAELKWKHAAEPSGARA